MVQYVLGPRFERSGNEVALAWARQISWMHERYYAVIAVIGLLTGIALVQDGNWDWSGKFIWVGIGAIVVGASLGGGFLGGLAKQRVAALEADDAAEGDSIRRRMVPVEIVLTLLPIITIVAMVAKWKA
jgi:hypothetical protein